MIKRRFLLLLILIMVITPVWSALGYYSGMVNSLSAEPSFEQAVAVTDSADAAAHNPDHCLHQDKFKITCHASGSCTFHICGDGGVATVNPDHSLHQDKFKITCHASGSCTFHICGDGGVATVFLLTQAYSAYRYEHWEKSTSRSLSSSPEIRPPINSFQQS